MNAPQQDPYGPKYGGGAPQQGQPMQYGGMPVQSPKRGINRLLIPLILAILLLLGAMAFGVWAYGGMQDYKTNVQPKIDKAVAIAEEKTKTDKDKEFVEKEKNPLKEYKGPAAYGTVSIQYPKTWSAFVTETNSGSTPVDGYFQPGFVPGIQGDTQFALRVKVVSQQYSDVMKQFENKAKAGKVKVSPYTAPKLGSSIVGSRVDGEINPTQLHDSMVLFPLRDKTIEISTESDQFLNDFNTIILPNLTFVP